MAEAAARHFWFELELTVANFLWSWIAAAYPKLYVTINCRVDAEVRPCISLIGIRLFWYFSIRLSSVRNSARKAAALAGWISEDTLYQLMSQMWDNVLTWFPFGCDLCGAFEENRCLDGHRHRWEASFLKIKWVTLEVLHGRTTTEIWMQQALWLKLAYIWEREYKPMNLLITNIIQWPRRVNASPHCLAIG